MVRRSYEKALQRLWTGRCRVSVRKTRVNEENGRNEPYEEVLFENEPCRLSFRTLAGTSDTDEAAQIEQVAGLEVPAGSKITVTQAGETKSYCRSGEPAFYSCHQEIILAPFERWA